MQAKTRHTVAASAGLVLLSRRGEIGRSGDGGMHGARASSLVHQGMLDAPRDLKDAHPGARLREFLCRFAAFTETPRR